jgi:GAF domain-containing protein
MSKMKIIDEPLQVRNELLSLETKEEIIQTALKRLGEKINFKTASIFLFSKHGLLERLGIHGIDADGNSINNDNFPDESYEIGQNITGLAALPIKNYGYGKTQHTTNPSKEEIKNNGKLEYLKRLKKIKSIISIPLNGQSKTYGVLEVINDSDFSLDDFAWLSAIQSYIATALSNFRRNKQTKILTDISNSLVNFDDNRVDLESEAKKVYQNFVNRLVSPETSFQVCILRIRDDQTNNLQVKAIAASESSLLKERNDDDREFGKGFVWEAVKNHQPKIILDISDEIDSFINKQWIENQGFKSFACFPLVTKKDVLGTLSLFVGYKYIFHKSCRGFLESVTSQLASFEENLRLAKAVRLCEGEEAYLKEIEQALKSSFNEYQQSKKEIKAKYKVEIEGKDKQIQNQSQQIEHLRELIKNLSQNPIQIIVS